MIIFMDKHHAIRLGLKGITFFKKIDGSIKVIAEGRKERNLLFL